MGNDFRHRSEDDVFGTDFVRRYTLSDIAWSASGDDPNQVCQKENKVVRDRKVWVLSYWQSTIDTDLADADRPIHENEVLDLSEVNGQIKPKSGNSDSKTTMKQATANDESCAKVENSL